MSVIVDVRQEDNYQQAHNFRSLRIPPEQMYKKSPGLNELKRMKPEEIVIMGDNLPISQKYRDFLKSQPWEPQVHVYQGGMEAWIREGKPHISFPRISSKLRFSPPVFFETVFASLLTMSIIIGWVVIALR